MIVNKISDNYGLGEIYYYSITFYIICYFDYSHLSQNGDIIIASHFIIYDNNTDDEITLENTIYAREVWKAVFDIKKLHYEKYKPAIVAVEIPYEYTSSKRINNYLTRLNDICGDTGDVFKYNHFIYYGTIPNIDIYKNNRLGIVEKKRYILSYKKYIDVYKNK